MTTFATPSQLTDAQLDEAVARIRKTLLWANGEWAADLYADLDALIDEQKKRGPAMTEGEARAMDGNR